MHRVVCVLLLALLSACGQSGELYLRSEPPPAETPPAAAPADPSAPQEAAPEEREEDKDTP